MAALIVFCNHASRLPRVSQSVVAVATTRSPTMIPSLLYRWPIRILPCTIIHATAATVYPTGGYTNHAGMNFAPRSSLRKQLQGLHKPLYGAVPGRPLGPRMGYFAQSQLKLDKI
jgi:hypothetical protein